MSLSKKTFVYSAVISGIIVFLMIAYFVLMLPSLYTDHIYKLNLNSIETLQKKFLEYGNYDHVSSRNPTGTVTIRVPSEGGSLFLTNLFGTLEIKINDSNILNDLNKLRYYLKNTDEIKNIKADEFYLLKNIEGFVKSKILNEDFPFEFRFEESANILGYSESSSRIHNVSDDILVFESNTKDQNSYYTNFVAMSQKNNDIILSFMTTMMPEMQEIRPIIFKSFPMIIAAAILLIIISTLVFSKKIVTPVEKLVNHAVFMKNNTSRIVEPIKIEGKDEIAILGETLNELHQKLYANFNELEEKNRNLLEQSKKQEVFLRASSHQLKTPVAAALLLVEGMIAKVGKYKNADEYLPQVKNQLLSMRMITDEILSLNSDVENIKMENIRLADIINEALVSHEVQIKQKALLVEKELSDVAVFTDKKLFCTIVDNLVDNAVKYTKDNEKIKITLEKNILRIVNYGAHIDEELLPNIFEPFVSGSSNEKGHGLGLYIVSYYADMLYCKICIRNTDDGVEVVLLLNQALKQ